MVTSTITGLAEGMMNYKWGYLWTFTDTTAFTNNANVAINVSPSTFIGFIGAAFAFLLSCLGAIENAS